MTDLIREIIKRRAFVSRQWIRALALAVVATGIIGCGRTAPKPPTDSTAAGTPVNPADAPAKPPNGLPLPSVESAVPEGVRNIIAKPFTGDFNEMVKRRLVRLGVPFNRTFYFIDKGVQRGAAYECGKLFEDELNEKRKTGNLKINVVFMACRATCCRPRCSTAGWTRS